MNLSYAVVSNHTLLVSWKYPPSLIKKITSFEVQDHIVIRLYSMSHVSLHVAINVHLNVSMHRACIDVH